MSRGQEVSPRHGWCAAEPSVLPLPSFRLNSLTPPCDTFSHLRGQLGFVLARRVLSAVRQRKRSVWQKTLAPRTVTTKVLDPSKKTKDSRPQHVPLGTRIPPSSRYCALCIELAHARTRIAWRLDARASFDLSAPGGLWVSWFHSKVPSQSRSHSAIASCNALESCVLRVLAY